MSVFKVTFHRTKVEWAHLFIRAQTAEEATKIADKLSWDEGLHYPDRNQEVTEEYIHSTEEIR